jgi:hypothetical protein
MHEEGHKYTEYFNWKTRVNLMEDVRPSNTKLDLKQGVMLWTGFD